MESSALNFMHTHKNQIFIAGSILGVLVVVFSISFPPWSAHYLIYELSKQVFQIIVLGTMVMYSALYYQSSRITEFRVFMLLQLSWLLHTIMDSISLLVHGDRELFLPFHTIFYDIHLLLWVIFIAQFMSKRRMLWIFYGSVLFIVEMLILSYYLAQGTFPVFESAGQVSLIVSNAVIWLIVVSRIKLYYPSKRTLRGKKLLQLNALFIMLAGSLALFLEPYDYIFNITSNLFLIPWLMVAYIVLLYYPEGFILTKHQTLSALRTYGIVLDGQKGQSNLPLHNLQAYIQNIPKDVLVELDNKNFEESDTQ